MGRVFNWSPIYIYIYTYLRFLAKKTFIVIIYHIGYAALTTVAPRRACAARVTVLYCTYSLSVCPSVCSYSRTTGYEASHERYQHLQKYANLKNKRAIFLERLHSRYAVKTSEKANNMHNRTTLPRPIRLLFVPCEGTISHHEGCVSTPTSACYLIV